MKIAELWKLLTIWNVDFFLEEGDAGSKWPKYGNDFDDIWVHFFWKFGLGEGSSILAKSKVM